MQMVVTANGGGYPGLQGKAFASPGFRTVYTGRHIPIASQVFGNVNQMVNTTIESAPGGGDAVLSFATFPQPDFYSGTVQGLYRLKLCPAVDSSTNACAHVSIWVDSSSPPAANTDKVEQTPCPTGAGPSLMGITWDNIYDIGPTQAHHSFLDIPQTYSGNLLVRYHNEGGVGSPTTLHEQVQINPPSSGTFSDQKPGFFACGIPNATSGELPVVDANASHANSWASQYIVGPYSFFGFAGPTGGSPIPSTGLLPWNTITLQNFKFVNATQGYTYTYVADGTTQNWGEASGPRPSNAIQNFNLIGNRIDSVSDGIFDDCNAQNQGMGHCTLDTFDEGNHLSNYGYPGDYLAHPQYRQAFRVTSLFDLYDGAISGSQGTLWFSDRGTRSFHQYNRVVVTDSTKQASVIGGHSENQDAYNILNEDEFYGYQGSASCTTANSTSLNCLSGWTLDPTAWQAAVVEEHNRTDYQIGNAISQPNVNKSIGVEMTHSWFSYQPYGGGYSGHEWFPENLSQNLFFAYNTIDFGSASVNAGAEQLIEDTRLNFSDAGESLAYLLQPQHYPEIWMTNNLIPLPQQSPACDYACNTLNVNAHQLTHFQTNMFGTITTPAGAFNSSTSAFNTNGWTLAPSVSDWGPIDPITDHLSGWTTPNFLTYSTFPVDTTTLVPSVSSDAVGAATTLTGDIAAYPPRYNAVDANMGPFTLRTSATTLGAYDPSGGSPVAPTVTTTAASSITTTTATAGGNVTSDGGASITARGTCYATTSNPTTPCTSDGTGTGSFASSLTGLTASTTYHIRAFATNSVGTSYGSDMTFTTAGAAGAPTVTTTAASSITATTATAGGNVTSDGGSSVTSRGVCYSTSSNPTTPCTSNGTGTGTFSASLSGLTASTTYHIRGFATNTVGTSYGSDLTFTTSAPPPPTLQLGGYIVLSGPNLSLQK
jgi:hypothetical protein